MKTGLLNPVTSNADAPAHAPIVELAEMAPGVEPGEYQPGGSLPDQLLAKARAFAEPLLTGQRFDTGEDALNHADGVSFILHGIGAPPSLRAGVRQ
jgi:GTP pyrophosphokinase